MLDETHEKDDLIHVSIDHAGDYTLSYCLLKLKNRDLYSSDATSLDGCSSGDAFRLFASSLLESDLQYNFSASIEQPIKMRDSTAWRQSAKFINGRSLCSLLFGLH
jgi:hypothetical protein